MKNSSAREGDPKLKASLGSTENLSPVKTEQSTKIPVVQYEP